MVKLLEVKQIEDKMFELLILRDGKEISFTVKTIAHKVESIKEPMNLLVPETNDREFADIWGRSFELRQEVGKEIQALKHKSISELQIA